MAQRKIELGDNLSLERLFGVGEGHLRRVRERLGVRLVARGNMLKVMGSDRDVRKAHDLLCRIVRRLENDPAAGPGDIDLLLEDEFFGQRERGGRGGAGFPGGAAADRAGRPEGNERLDVRPGEEGRSGEWDRKGGPFGWASKLHARRSCGPKTEGQRRYMQDIAENDIVFSIGPAGTGKTFLGVAMAIEALRAGSVRKIVLARPAVEAGEKLGFLPGDYQAKVNPYLRPLYDALNALLEYEQVRRLLATEVVEVVPLAYMRGRTLDEAFIILDEAQNTTSEQMKMFLTRMGLGSKIVVTGDITQIDLPEGKISGLVQVQSLFKGIKGIAFSYLGKEDIVRHSLVQKIVEAYEKMKQRKR
ncbi:MAG: PhoH family protein [Planctomycetota bacterium]|nr:PhoH family protein [Planctomycetota bacterium]